MDRSDKKTTSTRLEKARTGIEGLDSITEGGLPKDRPTLICGHAGCGKTLLAMQFLVNGATEFEEPGVFFAFEETAEDLTQNVQSLGFDLKALEKKKKLAVEYVRVDRSEIVETGSYDLSGLFVRLEYAIDSIGAKRVVLDTIETLFSGLENLAVLRSEIRRLFSWLREKGVTAIITGERGDGRLTRHGLEEYVSDCVILLDHRVDNQISTRRLRIVKYRGSTHGTNEYPFVIDPTGISVMPISSIEMQHTASSERISSGVPQLDAMLGGKGLYKGSTVLVSGTAGTGKTSLAASFLEASLQRGERCIFYSFEESKSQLFRNMRSVGIDLEKWSKKGLLQVFAVRQTRFGLEQHLTILHKQISDFKPQAVVLDPVSDFMGIGNDYQVKAMLSRLIDLLKSKGITAFLTSLTTGSSLQDSTEVGISSLIDTWLLLKDRELNGERNRLLYLLKSRGMPHSNQVREFLLTNHGIELQDVYIGSTGVLTGSARMSQLARDSAMKMEHAGKLAKIEQELLRKRELLEAQIKALRLAHESAEEGIRSKAKDETFDEDRLLTERIQYALDRQDWDNRENAPRKK